MLKKFEAGKVHLMPGLFKEREEVNRKYLMDLKLQGLLQNFYLEAGIVLPGLQVWRIRSMQGFIGDGKHLPVS